MYLPLDLCSLHAAEYAAAAFISRLCTAMPRLQSPDAWASVVRSLTECLGDNNAKLCMTACDAVSALAEGVRRQFDGFRVIALVITYPVAQL